MLVSLTGINIVAVVVVDELCGHGCELLVENPSSCEAFASHVPSLVVFFDFPALIVCCNWNSRSFLSLISSN